MKSKVYFATMRAKTREDSLLNKVHKLFKRAGFEEIIEKDDLVAIKLHFGEPGNTGFIRPIYVKQIVEEVKRKEGKPFLTDANTLYRGKRKNAVDHLNTAISNGFSYATIGAPLIIADGFTDRDIEIQQTTLDFFNELRVECLIIGPLWFLHDYNPLRDAIVQHNAVVAFDVFENLPISHVKLDVYTGAQLAVEHLASKGHRKIGYLGPPRFVMKHPILRTRYSGFCEKVNSLGLDMRAEWIIPTTECQGWSAYPVIEKLLDTYSADELPTAWFCQNDVFAAKLINILRKRNMFVPEDVAIVGFDNQPLAELTSPTLTSVGFELDREQYHLW